VTRARLGWIGPAIVMIGLAIGVVAVWYWLHARPEPGDEIDRIDCDGATIVVRAERGGERAFVELVAGGETLWQALIPPYAGARGRPAIACGTLSATVRVQRSGRAEVFGFALRTGDKIGGYRLAVDHEPVQVEPRGPITMTDHARSYEIVGGAGWHQLIAVDLATGQGLWKVELGPEPVTDGAVRDGAVWIRQGVRERRLVPDSGVDKY
jgi:hypothetical protein